MPDVLAMPRKKRPPETEQERRERIYHGRKRHRKRARDLANHDGLTVDQLRDDRPAGRISKGGERAIQRGSVNN
jgi:hypothetical protein